MIAFVKARLFYLRGVRKHRRGACALLKQLKVDYPQTEIAKNIDQVVDTLEKQAATASRLAVGKEFPAFSEKEAYQRPSPSLWPISKGKICCSSTFGPLGAGRASRNFPMLLAAYEKFHGKGFEIIGISLDQNKAALTGFIKERGMTWAQYFDGLGWKNKLGEQYGIQSIPATFLLDGEGKIIGRNLRGPALEKQLAVLLK